MIDCYSQIELILDSLDIPISTEKPSEWAEKNRVLTSEVTSFPGKVSYDRFPYWREPVDCLSPDNPMRLLTIMGGAQIGKSTNFIETGIGYIIKNCPGNIILTASDKDLAEGQMAKKFDQMIQHSGLRYLIRPNTIKKKNLKTGDRDDMKEFPGGSLMAQSIKAVDKIKQNSFRYGFFDDFESAVRSQKQAGDIIDLVIMRFNSFKDKMKICFISTPEIEQGSYIKKAFTFGDQRYYFMPCPCCGVLIRFIWYEKKNNDFGRCGVYFEKDESNHLIEPSVGYVCQECGKLFKETHKKQMLHDGKWIATARPSRADWYSYHVSAIYSPPGFFDWVHHARNWLEIFPGDGIVKTRSLQVFFNLVLGLPYEERGKTPKITQLAKNTRGYKIGEVPCELSEKDGNGKIILLTCACDLNGFEDDARLDYEIVAHSESGTTYSIDAGSIGTFQRGKSREERETYTYQNNEPNNVWDIFLKDILQIKYISDNKKESFPIHGLAVDTGNFTLFAYTFIEQHQGLSNPLLIMGIKGEEGKVKKINSDSSQFRKSKENEYLYILEVDQIKDELASKMELKWYEGNGLKQPRGFMNFPQSENGKYEVRSFFTQFESEHKIPELSSDGSEIGHKWVKKNSTVSNHFWDTRVYNMAIRDIFVETILKEAKVKYYLGWTTYCEFIKQIPT
jgi:phage terminase large subunit GpA-like protein